MAFKLFTLCHNVKQLQTLTPNITSLCTEADDIITNNKHTDNRFCVLQYRSPVPLPRLSASQCGLSWQLFLVLITS